MTDSQIEIAAATLVLLREDSGPVEIFMVERAKTMGFAGGMMVFPGGKVDAADIALAKNAELAPGYAELDPVDAAARIAAIRETFEEAGVLLTIGGPVSEETRDHWRARIVEHEETFSDFLMTTGHRLDVEALVPFAHWCPPRDLEKKRFDTRFYLARMPAGETALHDGNESTRSHWITAADALARADSGENAIIFPTRRNLERLAKSDSIEATIAEAHATPVGLVQPVVETRNGEPYLCIPEGLGYPVTAEPLAAAMRG
ncbi:NUDIX domain-containing protein [Sphingoaurantiacus capsulatus]|uniref:NUDIX domain-containing protein n=1 Tax=Sphingoaurantiacus capsulatus TaxID=1771310 RepID=A0ABV7XCU1_9SPHN